MALHRQSILIKLLFLHFLSTYFSYSRLINGEELKFSEDFVLNCDTNKADVCGFCKASTFSRLTLSKYKVYQPALIPIGNSLSEFLNEASVDIAAEDSGSFCVQINNARTNLESKSAASIAYKSFFKTHFQVVLDDLPDLPFGNLNIYLLSSLNFIYDGSSNRFSLKDANFKTDMIYKVTEKIGLKNFSLTLDFFKKEASLKGKISIDSKEKDLNFFMKINLKEKKSSWVINAEIKNQNFGIFLDSITPGKRDDGFMQSLINTVPSNFSIEIQKSEIKFIIKSLSITVDQEKKNYEEFFPRILPIKSIRSEIIFFNLTKRSAEVNVARKCIFGNNIELEGIIEKLHDKKAASIARVKASDFKVSPFFRNQFCDPIFEKTLVDLGLERLEQSILKNAEIQIAWGRDSEVLSVSGFITKDGANESELKLILTFAGEKKAASLFINKPFASMSKVIDKILPESNLVEVLDIYSGSFLVINHNEPLISDVKILQPSYASLLESIPNHSLRTGIVVVTDVAASTKNNEIANYLRNIFGTRRALVLSMAIKPGEFSSKEFNITVLKKFLLEKSFRIPPYNPNPILGNFFKSYSLKFPDIPLVDLKSFIFTSMKFIWDAKLRKYLPNETKFQSKQIFKISQDVRLSNFYFYVNRAKNINDLQGNILFGKMDKELKFSALLDVGNKFQSWVLNIDVGGHKFAKFLDAFNGANNDLTKSLLELVPSSFHLEIEKTTKHEYKIRKLVISVEEIPGIDLILIENILVLKSISMIFEISDYTNKPGELSVYQQCNFTLADSPEITATMHYSKLNNITNFVQINRPELMLPETIMREFKNTNIQNKIEKFGIKNLSLKDAEIKFEQNGSNRAIAISGRTSLEGLGSVEFDLCIGIENKTKSISILINTNFKGIKYIFDKTVPGSFDEVLDIFSGKTLAILLSQNEINIERLRNLRSGKTLFVQNFIKLLPPTSGVYFYAKVGISSRENNPVSNFLRKVYGNKAFFDLSIGLNFKKSGSRSDPVINVTAPGGLEYNNFNRKFKGSYRSALKKLINFTDLPLVEANMFLPNAVNFVYDIKSKRFGLTEICFRTNGAYNTSNDIMFRNIYFSYHFLKKEIILGGSIKIKSFELPFRTKLLKSNKRIWFFNVDVENQPVAKLVNAFLRSSKYELTLQNALLISEIKGPSKLILEIKEIKRKFMVKSIAITVNDQLLINLDLIPEIKPIRKLFKQHKKSENCTFIIFDNKTNPNRRSDFGQVNACLSELLESIMGKFHELRLKKNLMDLGLSKINFLNGNINFVMNQAIKSLALSGMIKINEITVSAQFLTGLKNEEFALYFTMNFTFPLVETIINKVYPALNIAQFLETFIGKSSVMQLVIVIRDPPFSKTFCQIIPSLE